MKKRLFGGPHGLAAPAGALLFCIALLGFTGCESDPLPSEENKVLSFKIGETAGRIDDEARTITITFRNPDEDLSAVYPEITPSENATVDPNPDPEDPKTAWNLDNPGVPVVLTVFAENGATRQYDVTALKNVVLTKIGLQALPFKTEYKKGESIATKGLSVVGTYSDGSTKIEKNYTLDPPNASNVPGPQQVTVKVGDASARFEISVSDAALESIEVTVLKEIYAQGVFDPATDIVVTGTYSDESTAVIPAANVAVTGYDPAKSGKQYLVAETNGKKDGFTIEVVALESIEVAVLKDIYAQGVFDPATDIVVTGTYTDESTAIIPAADVAVTGYDPGKPGEQYLVAEANGKKDGFTIEVAALDSISVTPVKTKYFLGEDLDPAADIVVTGTYTDGSTITETVYDVIGYDRDKTTATGTPQTLTVIKDGATDTYTVTVIALNSLEVKVLKNEYNLGEAFDPAGIEVFKVYTDGSKVKADTADYTVDGYEPYKTGDQPLTVRLDGKTATGTTVTVVTEQELGVTIGWPTDTGKQPEIFGIPEGGIILSTSQDGWLSG
jgi:hypothetical protein